jgi:hypothetical protein
MHLPCRRLSEKERFLYIATAQGNSFPISERKLQICLLSSGTIMDCKSLS